MGLISSVRGVLAIVKVIQMCGAVAAAALCLQAQDVKEFEKHITEFTLPNGLQFVVMERHDAPAVSFFTYVRAGSAFDPAGRSGLANLFEQALFTGSDTIGTKNWNEEKKALDTLETLYDELETERNLVPKAAQSRIDSLESQIRIAASAAERLGQPKAFSTLLDENGSPRLSLNTTPDGSECSYSLPSNRLELWFLLESQRLMHPSFRGFYAARDTVATERERKLDGPSLLYAKLAATAFEAHPYRNLSIGWPGDLLSLRRADARAFWERYYVPGNVSIAIVGDVNPADAKRFATQYFGSWAAKPVPGGVRTLEPQQLGPKRVALEAHPPAGRPNPPMMAVIGYKRPSQHDKDDAALDVLQIVLGQGKTGLLQKEIVGEQHAAQAVQVRATFPAGQYPNLFTFALVAGSGRSLDESERALEEYLNRLKLQRIELPVIDRAKAQARVSLIGRLTSNPGIAGMLGGYQAEYRDWRKLFSTADDWSKVTADDLQRVLIRYFVPANRTTVYTTLPGQPELAPAGGKK